MYKIIIVAACIASVAVAAPKAKPQVLLAPLAVAPAAPPAIVTAHSSQVFARHYNALVSPVAAAPLVAAAPVVASAPAAPVVASAPVVAAAPVVPKAAPLVASGPPVVAKASPVVAAANFPSAPLLAAPALAKAPLVAAPVVPKAVPVASSAYVVSSHVRSPYAAAPFVG